MKNSALIIGLMLACTIIVVSAFAPQENKVKVYKIDDLLNRVAGNDTTYVVNFWATWCKPCVAELPEFEKLSRDSSSAPVKVLLVSLDFVEDIDSRLIPFLNKNNYTAECILLNETDATEFIPKLDVDWSGAIPDTLVKRGSKKIFAEKKLKMEELLQMIRDSAQ